MRRLKFFIDPINDLGPWLNAVAQEGYRLKSVNLCIYTFERTDTPYRYATQFIGANAPRQNEEYIDMLEEDGTRVFRAPINQGNFAFGKFRLRPYARGAGKVANTFQDYNKEILIVETKGETLKPLITDCAGLARHYAAAANAYGQGLIVAVAFAAYKLYRLYRREFADVSWSEWAMTAGIVLVVAILFGLWNNMRKQARAYKNESDLRQ